MQRRGVSPICPNPQIQTYKSISILLAIMAGFYLVVVVMAIIFNVVLVAPADRWTEFQKHGMNYALMLSLLLPFLSMLFLQRYWKRIELRRFAAVAGDRSLLALEQPEADATALHVPCTLELRPGKKQLLLMLGIFIPCSLLLAALYTLPGDGLPIFSSNRWYSFLIMSAILIVFMLGIVLFSNFTSGIQKLQVTGEGLFASYGGQKGFVRWEDARLFALYGSQGIQKKNAFSYELSSPTAIARWLWIQRPGFMNIKMGGEPISYEEYTQVMQNLNSYIVARTGLLLYDLRQEPQGDMQTTPVTDIARR